jgi:CheY-like chemotaxis protein
MSLVLIVDDQPPIRELLISWISRDGYETAQAADTEVGRLVSAAPVGP